MNRTSSIRKQLLLWLILPTILLGLLGSFVTYQMAALFANEAYDESLVDTARALASRLYFSKTHNLDIDLPPAAKALLEHDNQDKFFYQIIGANNQLVAGDPAFIRPKKNKDAIHFWDTYLHGQKIRVATVKTPIDKQSPLEIVTIQVAETFEGRTRLATRILFTVILMQILFVALSTCSVWFGVSKGLIPLENIRNAVLARSHKDLSPIADTNIPLEIQPLTTALNHLLNALSQDLAIKRRFISNAAHQIRTPLAGLKTHLELALSADDPTLLYRSLKQLETGLNRTIHLANQLLSLARTEPEAFSQENFTMLDLGELTRQVTREMVPQALAKDIDLGFEGDNGKSVILGETFSLKELIVNLIENAIRYTPNEGSITASVLASQNKVHLVIEDTGPGIPLEDREHIFERFYRVLREQADGSGLGLAIVKDIADAHQAEIHVSEGTNNIGSRFKISFPSANPA